MTSVASGSRWVSARTTCSSVTGPPSNSVPCSRRRPGGRPWSASPGLPVSIAASIPHVLLEIGHGEQHKSLATIAELCSGFADMGLTRNDVVIAVGGGMVTDVAGFAAASYHRGVPVVNVATTLLAMVDAAIGGKTGVNLPAGQEPGRCVLAATRRRVRPRRARDPARRVSCAAATARWPSTTS